MVNKKKICKLASKHQLVKLQNSNKKWSVNSFFVKTISIWVCQGLAKS